MSCTRSRCENMNFSFAVTIQIITCQENNAQISIFTQYGLHIHFFFIVSCWAQCVNTLTHTHTHSLLFSLSSFCCLLLLVRRASLFGSRPPPMPASSLNSHHFFSTLCQFTWLVWVFFGHLCARWVVVAFSRLPFETIAVHCYFVYSIRNVGNMAKWMAMCMLLHLLIAVPLMITRVSVHSFDWNVLYSLVRKWIPLGMQMMDFDEFVWNVARWEKKATKYQWFWRDALFFRSHRYRPFSLWSAWLKSLLTEFDRKVSEASRVSLFRLQIKRNRLHHIKKCAHTPMPAT